MCGADCDSSSVSAPGHVLQDIEQVVPTTQTVQPVGGQNQVKDDHPGLPSCSDSTMEVGMGYKQ